jgi:spoIIIJ-associated protein
MATPYFSPVRLTASSEEAAISQALLMVGVTREEVEVEVLGQTEKGVTVRVSPRRADADAPAPTPAPVAEVAPPVEEPLEEPSDEPALEAPAEEEDELVFEETDDDEIADEAVEELDEEPLEEGDDEDAPVPVAPRVLSVDPAQAQRAQSLAQEFLDRMGLEAEARITQPPPAPVEEVEQTVPQLFIEIEGEDVGILIGKHGQTLQSFQYLLNLTLNNRNSDSEDTDVLRVIVDAGGYRSRRAQSLEQAARHAASRAKRDRRAVRLDPMPAHERRLVHIALRGDQEISTGSEGREPHRYVVISPKNGGNGGQGGFGGRRGGGRGRFGSSSGNFGGHTPPRNR